MRKWNHFINATLTITEVTGRSFTEKRYKVLGLLRVPKISTL